jgi:hypothetical protein
MNLVKFATVKQNGEIADTYMCSADVVFLQRKSDGDWAIACPQNVFPYSHYYDFDTETFVEFERTPAPPGSPLLGDYINKFHQPSTPGVANAPN